MIEEGKVCKGGKNKGPTVTRPSERPGAQGFGTETNWDSKKSYAYMFENSFKFNRGFSLHYPLLFSIVYGLEAKNCFEFGAGLSTRVILDALEHTGGTHISCSRDPKDSICKGALKSRKNWAHYGELSSAVLPRLDCELEYKNLNFDFVLHDGSHRGPVVAEDLKFIVRRVKRFGMILIHDTQHSNLGGGMRDGVLQGLAEVPWYSHTTLPYGCGLTLVRIERGFVDDTVEITRRKAGSPHGTDPYTLLAINTDSRLKKRKKEGRK